VEGEIRKGQNFGREIERNRFEKTVVGKTELKFGEGTC
jgi:hypothetical protein